MQQSVPYHTRQRRQTIPFGIPTTQSLPIPGSVTPPPLPASLSGIGEPSLPSSQPIAAPSDGSADGASSQTDSAGSTPGDGESTPPSNSPSSGSSQPSSAPPSSPPPSSQPPSSAPSVTHSVSDSNSSPGSSGSSQPGSSQPSSSEPIPSTPSLPSSTPNDSSGSSTPPSPTNAPTPTANNAQVDSFSAQTTITSTIVTDINGVPTTIVTAIPTTLSNTADPAGVSSQRNAIVAGTTVAGVALACIIISLVFFCRRRKHRAHIFDDVPINPRSRSMLLAEEFDDTDDPHMAYRDYPGSFVSSSRSPFSGSAVASPAPPSVDSHYPAASTHSNPPPEFDPYAGIAPPQTVPQTSPHVMGLRASESGSIFHEAVWPPPGESSRMVDPILAMSSQVDLTRIVEDVMGTSMSDVNLASAPSHARMDSGGSGSQSSLPSPPHNANNPFASPPPTAYPPYERHYRNRSSWSLGSPPRPSASPHHTPSHSFDDLGSPVTPPPRMGALYVTNGVAASPVGSPKNWLERTPKITFDGASGIGQRASGSFVQGAEEGG
ncbi:hypothetical protein EUX98_g5252 [Antrodiella citrinella]|uniref:Uncharacterized protein n=1 Tax=Antrodiella citrinella TaxID=2447956 RepID=A0A4S4MRW6_9APHY|nr:hypothetical protein EUX98_g5252 [Antrodiella citrinella]